MKVLLVTGILLICRELRSLCLSQFIDDTFSVQGVASTSFNRTKRQSISIDKNKEVDDANALRIMIASIGVTNMNKVKWNDALTVPPCDKNLQADVLAAVNQLKQKAKDIGLQENVQPTEEQQQAMEKEYDTFLANLVKASARMPNSCVHPLQTGIKCSAEQLCEAGGIKGPNCICGPETEPPTPNDFKKGKPGSACKDAVEFGLCVNEGVSLGTASQGGGKNFGIMYQTIPTFVCLAIFYLFA
uniref:Secreted protein n=1 Tax=Caenorhabditis tropicalis TaxID=1561998 RepID=A0A1I7SXS0_9PELO